MTDLVGECVRAHWNVRDQHRDWLATHGVSPISIYCPPPRLHGHFGICRAQFHGDLYEPTGADGEPVIVMGVSEHPDEQIIDLVAFQPSDPTRWWLRSGQGVVLGLHNARLAAFKEEPVFVHATPLDWLRAECQGVVVLDWTADILSRLDGYGILTDATTGKRLEQAFTRHFNFPQIKIIEGQRHAA